MIRTMTSIMFTLLLFMAGCGREDTVRYLNKEKGYSIAFPKIWEMENNFMGSDVIAFVPQDKAVYFRPNINVVSEELQPGMDEKSYYNLQFKALTGFTNRIRNFHLIENMTVSLDGVNGKGLVYTYEIGQLKVEVISFAVIRNRKGYIITGTGLPDDFAEFREKYTQAAKSFRFE